MRNSKGQFIKGHKGIGNVFKKGHTPTLNNILKTKESNVGKKHHWKGGKIIENGYYKIKLPNHPMSDRRGYVRQHRLIVAKCLGRSLRRSERVHHVDGNKLNNRMKNLMAFTNESFHQKFENGKYVPEEAIVFDGRK